MNGIRRSVCCAVCALAVTVNGFRANAQTPAAGLRFEEASVKPVDPSKPFNPYHHGQRLSAGRASYWSASINLLVALAYNLRLFQLTTPEWANVELFDIEAKFPEGANKQDAPKMLQALLKDRFKLAFHIERREFDGYVLVVGKHPERLKLSLSDPPPPNPATAEADAPLKPGESYIGEGLARTKVTTHQDGSRTYNQANGGTFTAKYDPDRDATHSEYSKMPMRQLVGLISLCMGPGMKDVQDGTGLKGDYQVAYDCPMPSRPTAMSTGDASGSLPSDPQGSALLDRSLEAMGLKLEKRKVMWDVYVIDHVERPTEN